MPIDTIPAATYDRGEVAAIELWQFRSVESLGKINGHISGEVAKAFAKVLPATISEADRAALRDQIAAEVLSQVVCDDRLAAQVKQLIGWSTGHGTLNGPDYSNANLHASEADFDKVTELVIQYASPKLITKTISKTFAKWSSQRAADALRFFFATAFVLLDGAVSTLRAVCVWADLAARTGGGEKKQA